VLQERCPAEVREEAGAAVDDDQLQSPRRAMRSRLVPVWSETRPAPRLGWAFIRLLRWTWSPRATSWPGTRRHGLLFYSQA